MVAERADSPHYSSADFANWGQSPMVLPQQQTRVIMSEEHVDRRDRPRPRRRLQYSMLSLLIVMTTTCLALTWWTWPRPIVVESIVFATATPVRLSSSTGDAPERRILVYQQELLAALNDPDLLPTTVDVIGNRSLAILRQRSDPAGWLRGRFRAEAVNATTVSIKLTVPEHYRTDAVELVDYITLRCFVQVASSTSNRIRERLAALREEHDRQMQLLDETCRKIASVNPGWTSSDVETASLKRESSLLAARIAELASDIKTTEAAYGLSDSQLKLVQMAVPESRGR
jgi:hypothetical protein